jgi:hypothetical protein
VPRSWPPPLPPNAAGPRDEMDLLAFADFVLAWDHRNHPASVGYFFKIFDIQHKVSVINSYYQVAGTHITKTVQQTLHLHLNWAPRYHG